jgi:LysR family hydrogen peroxide-inducible transcriptional activator
LSIQVAEAESALGTQLFERDRRRVLVTPTGQALLQRARAVLLAAGELATAAQAVADPRTGTLRIGAIPTIAPYLVPEVAPALRRRFPSLAVQWSEERTATLLQALERGDLDAAILALESELGHVEQLSLATDPFVLALPEGHALGKGKRPLGVDAVRGENLLVLSDGHCLRDQVLSACRRAHASSFGGTSLATLVQMVTGGAGVTLLPTLALRAEGRREGLRLRSLGRDAPHRTLGLVWRRGAARASLLRELGAVMAEIAAKLMRE